MPGQQAMGYGRSARGANPEGPAGQATCGDNLDNDCDSLIDENDPDCHQAVNCSPYLSKETCNNDAACRWKGSTSQGQFVSR